MNESRFSRRHILKLALGFAVPAAAGGAAAQEPLSPEALMGVWRGDVSSGAITIGGEVIFYPDGTYQRMHRLGALSTWASGPYRIAANWIHFEVDDYEPKIYLGVRQYPPPSETWMVDHFDGRMIEGRIGDMSRFRYRKTG